MGHETQRSVITIKGKTEEDRSRDILIDFDQHGGVWIHRRVPSGEFVLMDRNEWDTFSTAIADLRLIDEVERVNNQR